ncbi:MAG: GTP 3',8-cyclase MoaA [Thermoproteota archaeon]
MPEAINRMIRNLRICVTEQCNLKCFFCHKEWDPSRDGYMSLEEIQRIAEAAYAFGIESIKITGGEPLMRKDIVEIVKTVSLFFGEVSMVTNGSYLEEYALDLRDAGLRRVNVNLPSLDPLKYKDITGGGDLNRVLKGIEAALNIGLKPIKLNMVVLKGLNDDEVWDMMDYAGSLGLILQLIELQPVPGDKQVFESFHLKLNEIEEAVSSKAVEKKFNWSGQRNVYIVVKNGVKTVVEIVSPLSNPSFCSNCSKIRVTSDGRLKPCLLRNDNLIDLISLVRAGADIDALKESFSRAVMLKEPYLNNRLSI